MLLNILKTTFILSAIVYILTVIIYKIMAKRDLSVKSSFLTVMIGFSLLIYLFSIVFIIIFNPFIITKIVMFAFLLVPFIIGKFATYQKEGFYSLLQILFITLSVVYILK